MKRVFLFFTLAIAVAALPQVAKSQNDAAVQERLRWISSFAMSGALYNLHLHELGLEMKGAPPGPDLPPNPIDPGIFLSYVATNDYPNQDVEPTISTVTMNGVPYITTAYISYSSTGLPNIHSVTTTNSFGAFTPGTPNPFSLPLQVNLYNAFSGSYDPVLAANTGGGVNPGWMYAAGVAYATPTPQNPDTNDSLFSVNVWRSADGGFTWSSPHPTLVEDNHLAPAYELDHPHITVDTSSGRSTSGWVFVTYIRYDAPPAFGTATIRLAYTTNGGSSFTQLSPPASSPSTIGGAQLAVDPTNSNLYLVWVDYTLNALRVSTASPNNGYSSWSTPVDLAISPGRVIGPVQNLDCLIPNHPNYYHYPCLSNYIRVYSLPIIRYNPVAGVLDVTWHQRENMGTTNPVPTDVYSSSFNGSTWATPFAVSAIAGVNEFMPALDSDAVGYVNITFYSTYGSANNATYREWRACTACGIRNKVLNGLWSDPAQYTIWPYFIGDYQDGTSIRGQGYNEYVPAWVGINGSNGEIHLTDVSY